MGIYSHANNTIISILIICYALLIKTSRLGTIFLLISGAAILLLDDQRGGYLNLLGVLIFFKLKDFKSLIKLSVIIPIIMYLLLKIIPYFSGRDPSGFFLSIIFPEKYKDSYSSGAHRMMQITEGIQSITSNWKSFLFGNGPSVQVFEGYFNDIHNGYVSFATILGVPATVFLLYTITRILINIRKEKPNLFSILFVCMCFDALTQTTFSSVPTASLFLYSMKQVLKTTPPSIKEMYI
jgi:hypothetical protein